MGEAEQRPINEERAGDLVKSLRESFSLGKTRSYAWRDAQLKGIIRMIDENEEEILNALHADLSKPRLESFVHEISLAKSSCTLSLKELQHWMKPEKVSSMLTAFPSSAEIVPEPLGVVLIISAWNYPFSTENGRELRCFLDSGTGRRRILSCSRRKQVQPAEGSQPKKQLAE